MANLSSLPHLSQSKPDLQQLLTNIADMRSHLRQLVDDIATQYAEYQSSILYYHEMDHTPIEVEKLDSLNDAANQLMAQCKDLRVLRNNLENELYQLGEILPKGTQDMLRRGNLILFPNVAGDGSRFLIKKSKEEYVVEKLADGRRPTLVTQDEERILSISELLAKPDIANCLASFAK